MLFHLNIGYSSRRPLVCGTVMLVIMLAGLGFQVSAFMSCGGPEAIQVTGCTRSFTEDSLYIGVQLKSDCPATVSVQCRLVVPEEFIERATRDGVYHETPYYNAGPEVMESDWFTMDPEESRECTFEIPVQGSFIESEYYEVVLTWHTEWGLFSWVNQKKTLSITPFESVESSSVNEYEQPDGTFQAAYDPDPYPDLRATSVSLVSTSLYKGDAVHAKITVRNYGDASAIPSLNVQVKELTKLYVGFDRGVWALYGNGQSMGSAVVPGYSKTYDFYFGPVLYDSSRGIWALNGRVSHVDASSGPVSYRLSSVRVMTYFQGAWMSYTTGFSSDFTVTQHPTTHRVLAAVIDDQFFPYDPAVYCEAVMDFPLRIGDTTYTGPLTSFEAEFGFDFMFYNVGQYTWPWYIDDNVASWEALQITRYTLGSQLKLGSDWTSEGVAFLSTTTECGAPTMRENHGFDLGIGLMSVNAHSGEGLCYQIGNYVVAIGGNNWDRVKECLLHEMCHQFGARHGDEYGTPTLPGTPFGPGYDGLTYVMGAGDGNDFDSSPACWRMNPQTSAIMRSLNHLRKFDGAAAPSSDRGQGWCHVTYGLATVQSQVYKTSSYVVGDGGSLFSRFHVIQGAMADDLGTRWWRTTMVDANIVWPNTAYFYVAHHLEWSSDHWPSGFSPSNGMFLRFDIEIYQCASRIISTVTNVDIKVNSALAGTPTTYYSAWFLSNNPATGSGNINADYCYKQWGACTAGSINIADSDGSVYFLVGFGDVWTADWSQLVYVHPQYIILDYPLTTWQ